MGKRKQVVVITGASAGIGRATAEAFARQGACVCLIARDGIEHGQNAVGSLKGGLENRRIAKIMP